MNRPTPQAIRTQIEFIASCAHQDDSVVSLSRKTGLHASVVARRLRVVRNGLEIKETGEGNMHAPRRRAGRVFLRWSRGA